MIGVGISLWNSALTKGGGFSLDAYLASLSGGFRFNTRKTDRYFQESTGPTLADDVGETIGLALSQRLWAGKTLAQVLAAQTEIISNGDFSNGTTGWVGSGATLAVVSGELEITRNGSGQFAYQVISTVVGRAYRLRVYARNGTTFANAFVGTSPAGQQNLASTSISSVSGQFFEFVFFATATTTYVQFSLSAVGTVYIDNVSVKEIPGNHAVQTGASTLRPIRQSEGAKFDASDDNLLMGYLAATGSNFIQTRTTVPASLSATQVIAGASGAGANREFLGVNTSGFACAGVGSDSTSTIVGSTDLRGTEADIAVTHDGSTVRLIVNGAVEYEAAQNSTPTTSIPFRIGALNNNGAAGSFYGGAVKDIAAGTDYLTLARFNQIRAAMAANQ